jgi:sterol 3beta-glucosyltransferase
MAADRITILAFGSMGDVAPYLALGVGLRSAGYRVNFVTHSRFSEMASKYGVSSFGIDDDPMSLLKSDRGQRLFAGGAHAIRSFKTFMGELEGKLRLYTEHVMQQSEGSDLLLASTLGTLVAVHVAQKLSIPCFPAFIQPITPSSRIPNAHLPTFFDTSPENWVSHQLFYRFASIALRGMFKNLRQMIGLSPTGPCEPFSSIHRQQLPVLYGYSEAVVPRPADWMEHTHVTGYWFLPRRTDWQPPDELVDFLASGAPPVCVGFGSMIYEDPEAAADLVLAALEKVGCRGLLLTGWGALKPRALPANVFATESVPHDWLFSRVAAVVHHAGAGTTAAALRAGLPSVPVPFVSDQFFWAQRLNWLGVAPRPIPRQKLSSDALAEAISIAVGDDRLKRNAVYFAERIASEDGVRCAVEEITRCLRN